VGQGLFPGFGKKRRVDMRRAYHNPQSYIYKSWPLLIANDFMI